MLKKNYDDSSSVKDESEDAPREAARAQADYIPAARRERKRPKAMTQYQAPRDSVDHAEHQGSSNDEYATEAGIEVQPLA